MIKRFFNWLFRRAAPRLYQPLRKRELVTPEERERAVAWLRRDALPPLVPDENVHCRFPSCNEPAVAIWETPEGCICWTDPVQALCWQHGAEVQSTGPIRMICRLIEIEVRK